MTPRVPSLLRVALACALALVVAAPPRAARAHGFAPVLIELRERADGRVELRWSAPSGGAGDGAALEDDEGRDALRVHGPAGCRALPNRVARAAGVTRAEFDCGRAGLAGRRVRVEGLELRGGDGLVRVDFADGRRFTAVVRPEAPVVTLPEGARDVSAVRAVARYVPLGVRHIATGVDHLLFVLGLLLLCGARRRALFATVTAFTLGHSATLALAALDVVRVPAPPVETAIALSIALLAVELASPPDAPAGFTQRRPAVVAAGFGLLHGLGFAGALAEVGLPRGHAVAALAGFNAGVELGQLAFVSVALGLFALAARARVPAAWRARARGAVVYTIGAAAVFWSLDRAAALW